MKWGADYPLHPVGTGPFRFACWDRGPARGAREEPGLLEVPGQDRPRDLPADRGGPGAAHRAPHRRRSTSSWACPPTSSASSREVRRSTSSSRSGAHVWYLGINNQKKPFDDKRVRQALNYAVNKDAIVRDVLKGTGSLSKGPVLPGTWGADAALKAYPYDPAAGQEAPRRGGLPERLLDHACGCRSRARACRRPWRCPP